MTLARVQGNPVKLGGGAVTVVEFWATWCVRTAILPILPMLQCGAQMCWNSGACSSACCFAVGRARESTLAEELYVATPGVGAGGVAHIQFFAARQRAPMPSAHTLGVLLPLHLSVDQSVDAPRTVCLGFRSKRRCAKNCLSVVVPQPVCMSVVGQRRPAACRSRRPRIVCGYPSGPIPLRWPQPPRPGMGKTGLRSPRSFGGRRLFFASNLRL